MQFNYHLTLRNFALTLCLTLGACATQKSITTNVEYQSRWINASIFDATEHNDGSLYSFNFDIDFTNNKEETFKVTGCLDVQSIGEERIASREFTRWTLLKDDCEVVSRFYSSPKKSINYWPDNFDYPFIKSIPATAIPYFSNQGLDNRNGTLSEQEPTLTFIEAGQYNVKVSFDGMVVDYELAARGDFNRDGYQDLFIRMSWYIEEAFGDGYSWVVLTKLSPEAPPMILWQKH
jgi:hypothetical protein